MRAGLGALPGVSVSGCATAVNPVVALELLDSGAWSGTGVLGPEALPAEPFLDVLNSHGAPRECEERTSATH